MGMVRTQIYIKPEQDEVLEQRSKELGISKAELIRQYIDEGNARPTEAERKQALEELRASWKERAKMRVPQTGRTWTRDELYEERFERYSR
ncbi:MAG TPA: ribbon-helix-helix domain-containing protein [Dehalococcoidia bacterium]|jgi:hypothetical protein|nr:ribbon-helix-helix domain-containing protein [Dehalococcoidia bacterium]